VEFWNFALGNLFLWKSALSKNSKYTVCVSLGRRDCNTIKSKVWKTAVCHVRFLVSPLQLWKLFSYIYIYIYIQARKGPEVSRKLRFPDFVTTAQDGGKVVSLTHRPPLPPRKYSWYSFLLEAESTLSYIQGVPGGMCETSGECSLC